MLLATLIMLGSYFLFIYALAAASGSETTFAGGLLGIGLGLVPGVFAAAAWVSQNPHTIRSTLAASGFWLVAVLIIGYFSLPIGLIAGFGAGGVIAFRLGPEHSRRTRTIALALCVLYAAALMAISFQTGLFGAAPLPFVAIALADLYSERSARKPGEVSP